MRCLYFGIVVLFLFGYPLFSKDFTYKGDDCTIVYRFVPDTGTLNDLTVIYNGGFKFHPCYSGSITVFELAGKELNARDQRHTSKLLEEKQLGDVYETRFRWSYKGDSFDFTIKMMLNGKTLGVEYVTDSSVKNVKEFGSGRSEQTPHPKIIYLPYGHNVLFSKGIFISSIIDHIYSNASVIASQNSYYSHSSAYYGFNSHYHNLTNGNRNNLKEKIYITVSPDITETFFKVSNPVSPYRDFLVNKVIVDLWSIGFEKYKNGLKTLAALGMTDLFVIFHVWQKYGYDNGLPTTFPAGDTFGGENSLSEVIDVCEANKYIFAFHTNYVDFYENSDVWDGDDVALQGDGTRVKAWYNQITGNQSYLMKPSRVSHYAGLYEPLIHDSYGTNAGFLDVHSSINPSIRVDYDSKIADAGKQSATFFHYKNLIAYVRDIHSGPVAGEGFGSSARIWSGYIDAIEADPRSSHIRGGTDVPLIVDYKLHELHHLFVPHGAGYLERFFLGKWYDFSKEELERYRVTQIAFGNAGFIHNPFEWGIPIGEVLKDYCFLKHLQRHFLTEIPQQIQYFVEGQLLSLSDLLRNILPSLPTKDLNIALNEALSMIRIVYSGGFTLYVNRSAFRTWDVVKDSAVFRLPPNGFLAFKGIEFLAYTAMVNGKKKYYLFPKETACCEVIDPVIFDFNGIKRINRSLLQVEYINQLTWKLYRSDSNIKKFRIYCIESGGWNFLAELDSFVFEYLHRSVEMEKPYTYALVTVDSKNRESNPIYLEVK